MLYLPHLDIWGAIFKLLPPVDLIHFGQTNKSAWQAVTNYNQLAFDIKQLLLPYFSDEDTIQSFRQLQFFTGTLISGSTALQLFDRRTFPESDLDIYVEHRYCHDVAWWLGSKGYKYRAKPTQPASFDEAIKESVLASEDSEAQFILPSTHGYLGRGIANAFDFFKSGSERKIQLMSAVHCPLEIILDYHSTCVMNFITHNTAYSLYPYATFQQRRSLSCGANGQDKVNARKKYEKRGWKLESRINTREVMDRRSDFRLGTRWVGDERCWTIPFLPPLPEDPPARDRITSSSWDMRHFLRNGPRMSFAIARSPKLRFQYVCADNEILQVFKLILENPMVDDDELNRELLPQIS